jgi:N6-L-threonylcarbamoyladenine synthase
MIVLGIETSCDETAVGIVTDDRRIIANQVYSQIREQAPFGGVVPEIAARAHVQGLEYMVRAALDQAGIRASDLSGVAATCGPGLIGGVMVGMMMGKGLAASLGVPFLAVNHLEAHVLTARLTHDVPFPYLTLLVSGGHTQWVITRGLGDHVVLGETLDDAAGEAFDKAAKLLGLGYPGGPAVERAAAKSIDVAAACARYPLPRPLHNRPGADFSFSGLKTAVRETVDYLRAQGHDPAGDEEIRQDLCASIQTAIGDVILNRLAHVLPQAIQAGCRHGVVAGGVAANQYLRARMQGAVEAAELTWVAPPLRLCTDNGVMIAWAGMEKLQAGHADSLDTAARPRWPLSQREREGPTAVAVGG